MRANRLRHASSQLYVRLARECKDSYTVRDAKRRSTIIHLPQIVRRNKFRIVAKLHCVYAFMRSCSNLRARFFSNPARIGIPNALAAVPKPSSDEQPTLITPTSRTLMMALRIPSFTTVRGARGAFYLFACGTADAHRFQRIGGAYRWIAHVIR